MDIWVLLVYGTYTLAIVVGLVWCWKSDLPMLQKVLWSMIVVIVPIGGMLAYFLFADEAREVLS